MIKKEYCFSCDKNVRVEIKEKINTYTIHGREVKVKEKVGYCTKCHEEIIETNLNDNLRNCYDEYLKLYNLSFNKFKEIRESLNLSQELFSKALGWSKKTVIRYEKAQSLPQQEYLYIYQRINKNKQEFINLLNERKQSLSQQEYYKILDRVKVEINPKTINTFLYMLKDNPKTITQIMKNFFALDFFCYQKTGKSLTSLSYAHGTYGPIIDKQEAIIKLLTQQGVLEMIVKENDNIVFEVKKMYDLNLFSKEEIEIMNTVKNKLKNKSAKELTEWSHKFKGWIDTRQGEKIGYNYAKYLDLDNNW